MDELGEEEMFIRFGCDSDLGFLSIEEECICEFFNN